VVEKWVAMLCLQLETGSSRGSGDFQCGEDAI